MQRIIITGASSGIGAALARHYATKGATLGLVARQRGVLEQLQAELNAACEIYPADVRDVSAMREAARHFIARHGVPDVVIANAGISAGTQTDLAEDIEAFQAILDTNLVGMVKTFQPFLTAMLEEGRGRLVGIASVAGYRGLPGASAYSASKAAAISYLESLRVELRKSGVKVVTICPGYVATSMTAGNPYPMPFILDADSAARVMAAIIERGSSFAVLPWQMAILARLLRLLPDGLYDALFAKAPRKPRRSG